MTLKNAALALLAAITGTGCATPEQQQERSQAYVQALQGRCAAYGFQPGTDAFAGCIQQEHLRASDQAQGAAAAEQYRQNAYYCGRGVAAACRAIGR